MSASKTNGRSSDEEEQPSKPKRRNTGCNPFKRRDSSEKDGEEKSVPLVTFEPEVERETFMYEDRAFESSDVVTPVSPYSLKLFAAIREEELELVEEELATRTKNHELDELGKEGFALIHVAARYNMNRIINTLLDHGASINISSRDFGWKPLHLAARFNGLATLEALLQRGADPSLKCNRGSTPLHFAARRGNSEIVKILLEHPLVDINAADDSGKTPLHLSCSEGNKKVCQLLVNHGANIKAVASDKTTPLHSAINNGHSEIARIILNRAADKDVPTNAIQLLADEDLGNNTVLHMAAWNNDVTTVEMCLDNGADVNTRKCNQATSLHVAAIKGNLEMAAVLVSRGAEVDPKDEESKTPLHRAAMFNRPRLVEFLLDKEAKINAKDSEGRSPFLNAVAAGHVESARALLKKGGDISGTDLLMKSCVHIAVETENLKMLAMLLSSQVGINNLYKPDMWDRVPLHYAAKAKDVKILELVLSKQKRLSFRDENQKTPLHLAAETSTSTNVQALSILASAVNERDDNGRTPLHSAAKRGQKKACLALLNMGAEVDSKDNNHRTPLMWAAKKNSVKCAETLLDFKASADMADLDGDTALHVACGLGHVNMTSLLLERGANLLLLNKRKEACLEVAVKAGSSDVAMTIVRHKRWKEVINYQTSHGQSAISLLIEHFPEAAEVVLDHCVHHSLHLNVSDPDYAVTYDFQYLDPGPDVKASCERFSALRSMIKHSRERLLRHPLTLKLNDLKWDKLGRIIFLVDFITYLILMILFTTFIVDQRRNQDFRPKNYSGKTTGRYKKKPSDIYKHDSTFSYVVPYLILVFCVIHMIKEFTQIYVQRWNYFKDIPNYLDWALYITLTLFMVPFVTSPDDLDDWFASMTDPRSLWMVGAVSIFVCYFNMVLFLRRYRLFGTYISMFVEVAKTVFQVMIVFSSIILGFALVFHILLREQVGFHTAYHSIIRVCAMMIGELDLGAIFVDSIGENHSRTGNPLNPFPPMAFFFIFLCMFLLSISLMNLLVGLAVGDTEAMKRNASIKRLAMQIESNIEVDEAYPEFITRAVYKRVYIEKPNRGSWFQSLMEWLKKRFSTIDSLPIADDGESKPSELAELQQEMKKNKKRMKSMMAMVEAQNKLLRSLAKSIDPSVLPPEDEHENFWDEVGHLAPVASPEATDDKIVGLGKKESSKGDALFESGL